MYISILPRYPFQQSQPAFCGQATPLTAAHSGITPNLNRSAQSIDARSMGSRLMCGTAAWRDRCQQGGGGVLYSSSKESRVVEDACLIIRPWEKGREGRVGVGGFERGVGERERVYWERYSITGRRHDRVWFLTLLLQYLLRRTLTWWCVVFGCVFYWGPDD
jgi:hypothetical protein